MKKILDLTKPLNDSLEIYAGKNYSDPSFSCTDWSTISKEGFKVSALTLGTQTGTHIDAPAHFHDEGKSLDELSLENLVGSYFLIDMPEFLDENQAQIFATAYKQERMIFIRSHESGISELTAKALDILLNLSPLVWILDGEIEVKNFAALGFHRHLALRGKYLIENLHSTSARQVAPGGELIALPLALTGTSGSPCRIIVRHR